jgi:hypothetical protein
MSQVQPTRWNIFARELENVLQSRNLRLGQLDNRILFLHPEKVRRLQQSLLSPAHFPTLNPDELDRLEKLLDLTPTETNRLHAAVIATAVERTLMDRIAPDTALMAANDVFELCLATMRTQPDLPLATVVKGGAVASEGDSPSADRFDEVLQYIENGTLALHAARSHTPAGTNPHSAWEAQAAFAEAKSLLNRIGPPKPEQEARATWEFWYTEADSGYTMATAMLQSGDREGPT